MGKNMRVNGYVSDGLLPVFILPVLTLHMAVAPCGQPPFTIETDFKTKYKLRTNLKKWGRP